MTALGCAPAGDPVPTMGGGDALTATGVTVRLPVTGGELVARARTLEIDPDGGILLAGDASVALDAGLALDARAGRISIDGSSARAVLRGGVSARIEVPAAAGDAGGYRDAGR